jgi:hypothetical protein
VEVADPTALVEDPVAGAPYSYGSEVAADVEAELTEDVAERATDDEDVVVAAAVVDVAGADDDDDSTTVLAPEPFANGNASASAGYSTRPSG